MRDSFKCVQLKLIDTDTGRLVTWAEARALAERSPRKFAATAEA
jgi:hypothetical protein